MVRKLIIIGGIIMISINDVAQAFLTFEEMTPKKIQKLSYYAYSWYLVIEKNKLVDTNFEAWVHGPVERSLYNFYREFGYNKVPKNNKTLSEVLKDEKLEQFFLEIYRIYGELDGDELECLTHEEGPWLNARVGLEPWESCNKFIDDKDIIDFYSQELKE